MKAALMLHNIFSMALSIHTSNYFLKFKHPFKIAAGERTYTPSVFIRITDGNFTGYGEATLPPYLQETQESVNFFIREFFESKFNTINDCYEKVLIKLKKHYSNKPALAAIEMACMQIISAKQCISLRNVLRMDSGQNPYCTFTIGMDKPGAILEKLKEADDFKIIKIKLGGENDLKIVETICKATSKLICIDANQGWKNVGYALQMLNEFINYPVQFVEQPLPKQDVMQMQELKDQTTIPLIADESFQTINDLEIIAKGFDGINIKLMKCGGITPAHQIIDEAKNLNLKILIGCMSESSCGIYAAAQLAPLANWVDLDGPLLINNDPFTGIIYNEGKVFLDENGLQQKKGINLF